jgi:hypothetical protein
MLITRTRDPHLVYEEVDWGLLVFFIGLFLIVGGAENAGLTDHLLRFGERFNLRHLERLTKPMEPGTLLHRESVSATRRAFNCRCVVAERLVTGKVLHQRVTARMEKHYRSLAYSALACW